MNHFQSLCNSLTVVQDLAFCEDQTPASSVRCPFWIRHNCRWLSTFLLACFPMLVSIRLLDVCSCMELFSMLILMTSTSGGSRKAFVKDGCSQLPESVKLPMSHKLGHISLSLQILITTFCAGFGNSLPGIYFLYITSLDSIDLCVYCIEKTGHSCYNMLSHTCFTCAICHLEIPDKYFRAVSHW